MGRSNLFGAGGGGWVGAKVIIKVFLNFGGTFLAFIYNFTCEITNCFDIVGISQRNFSPHRQLKFSMKPHVLMIELSY